jgi:hypothetical protein
VHFHVCAVDGVFEQAPSEGDADAGVDTDTQAVNDGQSSPRQVIFHPASSIALMPTLRGRAGLRLSPLKNGKVSTSAAKDAEQVLR